ncbi:Xaa-Pro peptidase family protein [Paenibacillus oenotherae]|uniref:Xaa-Pro peptidase family protein n=1 Tax=Paenibacillus oenotherae TaxID=1435645 RepID=A0ABS7D966_9BACL|nr:Xaa-Pro peptidase family protein [Paenibacillus oenotherae]MBW7476416.1 Xaa-Pro peptidase family protein [Paenibacillus oenotherae]
MEQQLLPEEVRGRIHRLQLAMGHAGIEAFLITQHVDLYYYTGSMQAGYALVPLEGEPTFYVRRSVDRARREAAVRVEPLPALRIFRAALELDYPAVFATGRAAKIATEMDVLPAQSFMKLAEMIKGEGSSALVDGSALIRRIRMIKSPWEIGRIEAAAGIVAEALTEAANVLREGLSELELMARIEYELRIRGHVGAMRTRSYNMEIMTGMIGSGEAAAEPSAFDGPAGGRGLGPAAPQSVSRKLIKRDEPILIDIGCCVDGYVIDQTRTAVIGCLPDELAAAYVHSEAIIHRTEQLMLPGAVCETLYANSLQMAAEVGLSANFMGFGADQVRFLGHGIGLEVDEWPVLARGFGDPLEPGMVLAVEPKFTFPGQGVVGIENTYLITDQGPRQLTRSPEGLIIVP